MANSFSFDYVIITDSESPEQSAFDHAESTTSLIIDVDNSENTIDPSVIPQEILGYTIVNPGAKIGDPNSISRVLPMQHPVYQRLWAAKITRMQGRGQAFRNRDVLTDTDYITYQQYRLQIQFACPPYPVLQDADIASLGAAKEFYRYLDFSVELSQENIARDGATFSFGKVTPTVRVDGNGAMSGLPPGIKADTPAIKGSFIARAPKALFRWSWRQIPGKYLFGLNGEVLPTNIFGAIGKLNNAPFPDTTNGPYPTGTLLFLPPKFTPEDIPVNVDVLGLPASYPPRTYRVDMFVSYFDPPTDPDWNGPNSAYPWHGHNLVPVPIAAGASGQPYFYLATMNSANNIADTTKFAYQYYDFAKLFQL